MGGQVPEGVDEWWTDDEWWRWLPRLFGIPRRFTGGFYLALGASLLLVVASTWPQGPYSPSIAVQGFTAGAIIWYTFFTYRAAQKEEPTRLHLEPYFSFGKVPKVGVTVYNRSERDVQVRFHAHIYADEQLIRKHADENAVPPNEPTGTSAKLEEELLEENQVDLKSGIRDLEFSADSVEVQCWVNWRDDLGERGTIGPRTFLREL